MPSLELVGSGIDAGLRGHSAKPGRASFLEIRRSVLSDVRLHRRHFGHLMPAAALLWSSPCRLCAAGLRHSARTASPTPPQWRLLLLREPMVDDVPGVRAGRRVFVCSCAFGRAISVRRPNRLKTAAWRSGLSSFSALPTAAPDPRSVFRVRRSVLRVQLPYGEALRSRAAAAHFHDAVVLGWAAWRADHPLLHLVASRGEPLSHSCTIQ